MMSIASRGGELALGAEENPAKKTPEVESGEHLIVTITPS